MFFGIIFARTFLIPKFSLKINHTLFLLIFSSSAIILTVRSPSFHTIILTCYKFSADVDVVGRPDRLSTSPLFLPQENRLHHPETSSLDETLSPFASFNI
jgi:hypothetical protein